MTINPADPVTWVLVSFLGFIGLLLYYRVPSHIANALDERSRTIRKELEEARRLREEAQSILADYQRKQREAEKSAEGIVAQAKQEAQTLAEETRQKLKNSLERRTRLAEEKIERAEAQAMDEVRTVAVNVAVAAAEKVIANNLTSETAHSLVDDTIKTLKSRLN